VSFFALSGSSLWQALAMAIVPVVIMLAIMWIGRYSPF
jgi:hypothetical protein